MLLTQKKRLRKKLKEVTDLTEYLFLDHNKENICWKKNMLSYRDYNKTLKWNNTLNQNMKYAAQRVFMILA